MSSTNKTTNYGLNQWVGTDLVKREDFNSDNTTIDTKLKENATAISNLSNTVTSHQADLSSQVTGKGANIVGVPAITGLTAGDNLYNVLKSLFQNADNGQKSIANVVGNPTVTGDTYSKIANDIQTQKNNLATNLTNKGQSSVGTEALANLVAKVANVNTGKKYASGVVTATANTYYQTYPFTVSGLNFTPSCIVLEYTFSFQYVNYSLRRMYHGAYQGLNSYNLDIPAVCFKSSDTNGSVYLTGMAPFTINSDGFTTTIGAMTTGWSVNINWYAWE